MKIKKFTEIKNSDWVEIGGYLDRDFKFNSFSESFRFVEKVSHLSEELSHHPVILISFKRVNLKLKTNKLDAITDIDREMAKKINKIYENI